MVKRYIKLPAGSTRHWNHVVDARSGPGIKSMVRSKKQQKDSNNIISTAAAENETPEKINKKHFYRSKWNKKTAEKSRSSDISSNQLIAVSSFLDMHQWRK